MDRSSSALDWGNIFVVLSRLSIARALTIVWASEKQQSDQTSIKFWLEYMSTYALQRNIFAGLMIHVKVFLNRESLDGQEIFQGSLISLQVARQNLKGIRLVRC